MHPFCCCYDAFDYKHADDEDFLYFLKEPNNNNKMHIRVVQLVIRFILLFLKQIKYQIEMILKSFAPMHLLCLLILTSTKLCDPV